MDEILLIATLMVIGLVTAGALIGVVLFKKRRELTHIGTDYRALFVLGLCFVPLGLVLVILIHIGFVGLFGLGVAYLVIGIANRSKWRPVRSDERDGSKD